MKIPERIFEIESRIRDITQRFESPGMQKAGKETPSAPDKTTGSLHDSAARNESKTLDGQGNSFQDNLEHWIKSKSKEYGVHENLIRAVMDAESGGNPGAISPKGAVGLMQLMPETAKELGVDPGNPLENLDGGVRYLKNLAGEFSTLDEVLAAYNAGPGNVHRHGGVPPYRETRNYIEKIRGKLADYSR